MNLLNIGEKGLFGSNDDPCPVTMSQACKIIATESVGVGRMTVINKRSLMASVTNC